MTVYNRCAVRWLAATTGHRKATDLVNATKVGGELIAMVSMTISSCFALHGEQRLTLFWGDSLQN